MLPNNAYRPQHAAAAYTPAHLAASPQVSPLRRTLCVAGAAALLAMGTAPAAFATEIPDSSWTPDVPSIDGSESGSSGGSTDVPTNPETPVEPETPAEPETPVEPEVSVDPTPDPGTDDTGSGDVYIPDSGSSVPSYDETYAGGSTGSYGASEDAFLDPETVSSVDVVEDPAAQDAAAFAVATPAFGVYDEATRTFTGTSQPGYAVRVVLADGSIIGDVWPAEDGSFAFWVPDWCALTDVSLFVIDEWGNQLSDILTGVAVTQTIAERERAEILASVGVSTSTLATQVSTSLAATGVASSFEQPVEETMPVAPYVLGAGSALLAVAVAGGAVAAVRRSSRSNESAEPAARSSVRSAAHPGAADTAAFVSIAQPSKPQASSAMPATAAFAAVSAETPRPAGARFRSFDADTQSERVAVPAVSAVSEDDGLDELERLALSFGAPASSVAPARPVPASVPTPPVAAPAAEEAASTSGEGAAFRAFREALKGFGVSAAPASAPVATAAEAPDADPDDDPTPPGGGRPAGARFSTPADSTAAFLAVTPAAQSAGTSACLAATSATSGLASVLFAADDDPESTIPCSRTSSPTDPAVFAETARILATGTGTVHRIVASKQDLDLTGLDRMDDLSSYVPARTVADPLAESDDWRAIALRELADDVPSAAQQASNARVTGRTLATEPRVCAPQAKAPVSAYVAPVVGPSSLSSADARRRRALVAEAVTPAAAALRSRDEAFRAQREQVASAAVPAQRLAPRRADSQQPAPEAGVPVISRGPAAGSFPAYAMSMAPAPQPAPAARCAVTKDGVPIIARGAGSGAATPGPAMRAPSVSDWRPASERRSYVPDLEQFAPAAVATGVSEQLSPSLAAAVGAAQSAYASFAPAGSKPSAPTSTAPCPASAPSNPVAGSSPATMPSEVSSSVAAAYAAAVYANVVVPEPAAASAVEPTRSKPTQAQLPAVCDESVLPASTGLGTYDDYTVPSLSSEYISYLVQEEFEHRHETTAQRNAALGRMRIVNGAAQAPVSVKDSVNYRRHMA